MSALLDLDLHIDAVLYRGIRLPGDGNRALAGLYDELRPGLPLGVGLLYRLDAVR